MNAQHVWIVPGVTTNEHSHPHEQLLLVQSGTVVLDSDKYTLSSGGSLIIEGGTPRYTENHSAEQAAVFDVFSFNYNSRVDTRELSASHQKPYYYLRPICSVNGIAKQSASYGRTLTTPSIKW